MVEVLETEEAFQPGAFPVNKTGQERFALRLISHRYGRPEIPYRNWLTFIAGGALAGVAGFYLQVRGQAGAAQVAYGIVCIQLILAMVSVLRKQQLKKEIPGGHPHACHRQEDGTLGLSLAENEKVAARLSLDTKQREWIRWLAGLAQTFWGLLLSGIPPTFVMGETQWTVFSVAMCGLTFLGTLLFGKGVRDIFGLKFAEFLFITSHRMVIASGPGEARSLPWTFLKERPVVVGRDAAAATLGLALVPLVSVGRLPAFGLWGKDNMDEERAKELAAFAVKSRQDRLRDRGDTP